MSEQLALFPDKPTAEDAVPVAADVTNQDSSAEIVRIPYDPNEREPSEAAIDQGWGRVDTPLVLLGSSRPNSSRLTGEARARQQEINRAGAAAARAALAEARSRTPS